MKIKNFIKVFIVTLAVFNCTAPSPNNTLFRQVSTEFSGINFINSIQPNDSINILSYEYLYNGGGVGVGDFNNDKKPDLVFTAGQSPSEIYLNTGNFTFDNITKSSGINTSGQWCTGVSIVDINQDGYDDIYISVGGLGNQSIYPNLLYVNNGDATFTESAQAYGLADQSESIQALFFDYDRDGDLDLYLLNGGGFETSAITIRPILDKGTGRNNDRLYRNDFDSEKGHAYFSDVTLESGITFEGFGLGVSVIDANNDQWPDVYVSNDYLSRDFLYINLTDGTFKESALEYFGHTSHFSMGNDVADINNDGLVDLITVDMLPEDVQRRKLMSGAHHSHDVYQIALKYGYGHQQMRNMLQLNTGQDYFSEIGQLAGVDKSDWSWAPLIADFDNDGFSDIFITNGFGKDITDMDFVKYRERSTSSFATVDDLKHAVLDCLYTRPAIEVPNYAYKNNRDLTFSKVSDQWGFSEPSLSNGSVYVDLNNDGALDLVVNNINRPAYIYNNTIRSKDSLNSNYLKIKLHGALQNKKAIGAVVSVFVDDQQLIRQNYPVRGFQSSVDNILHYGIGKSSTIDSLKVQWPDGSLTKLFQIDPNQTLEINQKDSESLDLKTSKPSSQTICNEVEMLNHLHKDRIYNDFAVQSLLLKKNSNQGPSMAVGDLDFNGLEDLFVGGSYGEMSTIYFQKLDGSFDKYSLEDSTIYEDGSALIFDANNDGYNDIYVTSGGTERYNGHVAYQDRLYLGTSTGQWTLAPLPEMLSSTSTVVGADYDQDGDIDLFVGGRVVPGQYPTPPKSYILNNDSGQFSIVTQDVCPALEQLGMITSATWTDFNNDDMMDLIVVGEFMPVKFFQGTGSSLIDVTNKTGLPSTSGLWGSILSGDFDNDNDMDYVIGNLGLNSHLKVNNNNPIRLDYADFDNNGSIDPIISKFEFGNYYPIASLDQLIGQLPKIKKKFQYYNDFAHATTQDILKLFTEANPKTLEAALLTSSYIENLGEGKFKLSSLPKPTQVAPIYGMIHEDLNQDGLLDILAVGNDYSAAVGAGKYDASQGHCLINNPDGTFSSLPISLSGFDVLGDSRSLVQLHSSKATCFVVGQNNDVLRTFSFNNSMEIIDAKPHERYAIVEFNDGSKRRHEFSLGSSYFSQSSNKIKVSKNMSSVTIYNYFGKLSRRLEL